MGRCQGANPGEQQIVSNYHGHPLHLQQLQFGVQTLCSGCWLPCSGTAYACAQCNNYNLHKSCAAAPRKVRHPYHSSHTLVFSAEPSYPDGAFTCDACGMQGRGSSYHCRDCRYDLHIPCAFYPMQVIHGRHHHPLCLLYTIPYSIKSFNCDICGNDGVPSRWVYHCGACSFDAHLHCANAPAPPNVFPGLMQQRPHPGAGPMHQAQARPQAMQMPAYRPPMMQQYYPRPGIFGQQNRPIGIGGGGPNGPIGCGNGPFGVLVQQIISSGSGGNGPADAAYMQQSADGGNGSTDAAFMQQSADGGSGAVAEQMQQESVIEGGGDGGGYGDMGGFDMGSFGDI